MSTPWSFLAAPTAIPDDSATALIPLPSLAELTLTGPESAKFLQGQVTTDIREVEKGRVLPGAICSLKGRVLFSFTAIPDGENLRLVLPADQIADALAHLKKYAVFSKTQLQDNRDSRALLGLQGPAARAQVLRLLGNAPVPGSALHDTQGRWAMALDDTRYLIGLPATTLEADWKTLATEAEPASETLWWSAEIQAGRATVFTAARDLFQPQELNYPALEGVSYNKGCYTGQEVVARLYFRGKLKQRLYRLSADTNVAPAIGSGIFSGESLVGDVVMAASVGNHSELLAIVKNRAIADNLTLGEAGPALRVLPLPYALPADKEE